MGNDNSPENQLMEVAAVTLPAERAAAEALLRDPQLLEKINLELDKTVEGERENRMAIFLFGCISFVKNRGAGSTNNLLINSDSSSGKDYVSREVCALFPRVEALARASPTAFTYWKANDPTFTWDGRICRLTDVSDALLKSDAFKTFLSDKEKSVIVNKTKTGQTQAIEYGVLGKPVIIATTANANPSEELLNRFNILTLDESVAQTRAITLRQLREAAGTQGAQAPDAIIRSALALLQQVEVVIPFAEKLADWLSTDLRARRDNPRILNLIRASGAVHQLQRKRDTQGRVIAEPKDYEIAAAALRRIQTGFFVSLTRGVKRALQALQDYALTGKENPTVKELHAFKPLFSEKTYYDHFDKLAAKNLVSVKLEQREGAKQPVQVFSITTQTSASVTLPPYQALDKGSNDSEDTKGSKGSEDSKESRLGGTFHPFESFEVEKSLGEGLKEAFNTVVKRDYRVLMPFNNSKTGIEHRVDDILSNDVFDSHEQVVKLLRYGYICEV